MTDKELRKFIAWTVLIICSLSLIVTFPVVAVTIGFLWSIIHIIRDKMSNNKKQSE